MIPLLRLLPSVSLPLLVFLFRNGLKFPKHRVSETFLPNFFEEQLRIANTIPTFDFEEFIPILVTVPKAVVLIPLSFQRVETFEWVTVKVLRSFVMSAFSSEIQRRN